MGFIKLLKRLNSKTRMFNYWKKRVKILKHIRNKTNNLLNCFHPPSLGYIVWIQSILSSTYETFIIVDEKKPRYFEEKKTLKF